MYVFFSRFRRTIVFSVLLILIVCFAVLGSRRTTTLAAQSSKAAVASVPSGASCGGWNRIASPNLLTGNDMFYGVAASSVNSVWAVGYYTYSYGNQDYDRTLIGHWDGAGWGVVSSPNPGPGGDILSGVVVVNANSVWAVGASWDISGNTVQALIEHWNGKSWKVVSSPTVPEQLTAITRVSGTNQLWAVGLGGLIEHWDGTTWSIVSNPNVGSFRGVSANNANDVWAVGQYAGSSYHTLIEHWDGTNWSIASSPSFGTDNNALYGITQVPGTGKIWTVGYNAPPISPSHTLAEQWDGTSWSTIPSPSFGANSNILSGVAAISTRNIWAVGGFVNDSAGNMLQALIEHWDGKSWKIISSPSNGTNNSFLEAVTRVPGTTGQLWAVGNTIDSNNLYQTLIEFYC